MPLEPGPVRLRRRLIEMLGSAAVEKAEMITQIEDAEAALADALADNADLKAQLEDAKGALAAAGAAEPSDGDEKNARKRKAL